MDSKEKIVWGIVAIVLIGFLGNYLGLFSVFGQPSVGYKSVSFDGTNFIYSSPNSPDNNHFEANHNFMQWNGGNVVGFQFYQNNAFLQFYLKANNINVNDFSFLPGDGDCVPTSQVLKVNYCKVPTEPNVEKTTVDADGCQHYIIKSSVKTIDCICDKCGGKYCYPPNTALGNTGSASDVNGAYTGCAYSIGGAQVRDCSTYSTTVTNPDFGGTIDGVARNYKSILESLGFTLSQNGYIAFGNDVIRCTEYSYIFVWSGAPSSTGIQSIKNNYICEAAGTLNDGTSYDLTGTVDWESTTTGLVCKTSGGDTNKKISDGTVTFRQPMQQNYYRYYPEGGTTRITNICEPVTLYESQKTIDDYILESDCTSRIITTVACTESNWVSTISPTVCPSTFNQTKTWTQTGTCTGGVSHPASETIACTYVNTTTECTTNADCTIPNVCFGSGTCSNGICIHPLAMMPPAMPCANATWLNYPTCSYDTASCSNYTATCSDGIKNGAETGIDCGGTCTACSSNTCPAENPLGVYPNCYHDGGTPYTLEDFWNQYYIAIIVIGGFVLVLLFTGGKK